MVAAAAEELASNTLADGVALVLEEAVGAAVPGE